MPDTVLGSGNTAVNRQTRTLLLVSLYFNEKRQTSKKIINEQFQIVSAVKAINQ